MKNILQILLYIVLTGAIISNQYAINKISGVYFDSSILERIDALDYKPTNLIDSNVIVRNRKNRGSGSVIRITKNTTFILTAAHIVYEDKIIRNKYGKLEKKTYKSKRIIVETKNKKYKAVIIKVDKNLDIAIIKIFKNLKVKPVKIAKKEPEIGDIVWVISNPGPYLGLLNRGIFSFVKDEYALISTASYFGSSGGMAVNTNGEQIGVISNIGVTTVNSYFPSITVFNGITRTKELNKFLKGIL